MLGSEDEFGFNDDDDDILVAAAEAGLEHVAPRPETPQQRAPKRRRIAGPSNSFSEGHTQGEYDEDIQASEAFSDPGSDILSSPNFSDDPEGGKVAAPKPNPRYRIHIPKHAAIPEDQFFTQLPPASQSPYRIRGPQWQKQKPPSPPPGRPIALPKATPLNEERSNSKITQEVNDGNLPGSKSPEQKNPYNHSDELANLPSDAFSSPPGIQNREVVIDISSQGSYGDQWLSQAQRQSHQQLRGPQTNLRQTTLFGGQAEETPSQQQQSQPMRRSQQQQVEPTRKHNWPLAKKEEPPTHHQLNENALQTWVYPTNLGTIRDYQYSIVARGLYHNLLVALPTGLGKTFIAATIMLNWYRWTKDSQIVFVAPTKPLVSQQVDACFKIVGIPRSDTTMLTGTTPPGIRAEEWNSKRVFFMTPQTIINDLKSGICDPKKIVLLVVDEAHRATGAYAYVEVVKFMRRFNASFRVLALTATPGSSVEGVQEVIDSLGISRVEIRTEESIDIQKYVHSRNVEINLFESSEEMVMVMDLFSKSLQPIVSKLNGMNAYWCKDPMALTAYGCTLARQQWMGSDTGRKASMGVKGMVNSIFTILASLAHSVELLKYHGIGPFYHRLVEFRTETQENGMKASKSRKQIIEHESFKKMMTTIHAWINNSNFVGHPKLEFVREIALNHFLDAGEGRGVGANQISPASTRIMIFVHYRDSAEEAVRVLKRNEPMIRPHVFVGQASAKGSDGMDQKKQLDIIEKFKKGIYNTLVATSIGEEGLDIGEVDLIICYDASASPIRMLQRMGRTGRKRAGKIELLLMKGKEENNFIKAKDNYEKMQIMIADGTRFSFHEDLSPRIVPKGVQPAVDKRVIEIPPENSQADLPEPRKRAKVPKRPPKKFHMPDNTRLGFTKASRLGSDNDSDDDRSDLESRRLQRRQPNKQSRARSPSAEPLLPIETVFLMAKENKELEKSYLQVDDGPEVQTVQAVDFNSFHNLQRELRSSTDRVPHGRATRRFASMMKTMHERATGPLPDYNKSLTKDDRCVADKHATERNQSPRMIVTAHNKSPARSALRHSESSPARGKPAQEGIDTSLSTTEEQIGGHYDLDDLDDDDELRDFIDDVDNPFNHSGREESTSPPSLENLTRSDSDEELLSLKELLGSQKTGEQPQARVRRRKLVIDSDSDGDL